MGVEQKNVAKVEIDISPEKFTTVKVSYITSKFEVVEDCENSSENISVTCLAGMIDKKYKIATQNYKK